MDTTISFEEVAALVANPPSLAPRPNFTTLRTLRRHIQCALQHLSCPQSNILGWVGIIMARSMYSLLTTSPFRLPSDPGPMVVYGILPTPSGKCRCAGRSGPQRSKIPNILTPAHHRACCASNYRCANQTSQELLRIVFEYTQGGI